MAKKKNFNPSKPGKWEDSEERKSFIRRRNQFKEDEIDDVLELDQEDNFDEGDENEDDFPGLDEEMDGRGDFTGWDENIGKYDEDGNRNSVLRDLFGNE